MIVSVRYSIFGTLDCMSWSSLFTNFKLLKLELLLTPVRGQIGTIEAIVLLIGFIHLLTGSEATYVQRCPKYADTVSVCCVFSALSWGTCSVLLLIVTNIENNIIICHVTPIINKCDSYFCLSYL